MDLVTILQLVRACLRELWSFKYAALALGAVIAFAIGGYGATWKEKYSVTTTLYADHQNIIKPLLAGQASVTNFENRLQIVRDTMLSNKILNEVVELEFLRGGEGAAQQEAIVSGLRKKIAIKKLGQNYISVTYSDVDPERAYNVVNRLVEYFLKESYEVKQSESKQAFLFIDRQVNSYKEQLREAEENLKNFKAANVDLIEGRVAGNIEGLRGEITNLELNLEQVEAKIDALETQIEQEDRYLTRRAQSNDYRQRIAEATAQLDQLRLSLTDNHPDVVNLKQHIEGLNEQAASDSPLMPGDNIGQGIENPVYDQLRTQLAAQKVERSSVLKRLDTLRNRMEIEKDRGRLVAEKGARLAELTRDYDVTQGLYEDLLQRKERARLSMTLDLEGQGVTYKIQEPAKYPLSPSGLKFADFVMAGAVLAVIVPIGLIVGYVILDPRVRSSSGLEHDLGVELLGVVSKMETIADKRARLNDTRLFLLLFVVAVVLYLGLAASFELLLD